MAQDVKDSLLGPALHEIKVEEVDIKPDIVNCDIEEPVASASGDLIAPVSIKTEPDVSWIKIEVEALPDTEEGPSGLGSDPLKTEAPESIEPWKAEDEDDGNSSIEKNLPADYGLLVPRTLLHGDKNLCVCKVYNDEQKLKLDMRKDSEAYTGEKPFICPVCNHKCTNYRSDLKIHSKVHSVEKPFSCDVCYYKCKHEGGKIHAEEKPFSCNICNYECRGKNHIKIDTSEKLFSCDVCKYDTDEQPLSCNICDHKFNRENQLTEHLKVHTDAKPFDVTTSCKSMNTVLHSQKSDMLRSRYGVSESADQAIERHDRKETAAAAHNQHENCGFHCLFQQMQQKRTELMDLTDLPLPLRSNVLTEAQDAAASTSSTPFAEPPTTAAPKSKAQKRREYRQRIAATRTHEQAIAARKLDAERHRNFRLRKAANSVLVSGSLESTTASSSHSGARSNDVQTGTYLPLPSRSNVLTEAQDTAASTSSTPFAEPPTIAAPNSKARRQREYRQRKAASRTLAEAIAARKADAERQRNYKLRKVANSALVSGSLESTIAFSSHSGARSNDVQTGTYLPLPSRSNVLTEAQDAAASTSSTPLAEPPTTAAPKSKAQRQREYRQRKAASRTSTQVIAARKSDAERHRNFRLRKAAISALASGLLESTTVSSSQSGTMSNDVQTGTQQQLAHQTSAAEPAQMTVQRGTSLVQIEVQQTQSSWNTKWAYSAMRFKSTFLDNYFGYACSVCDRLWFKNDLKPITAAQLEVISEWFIKENRQLCREEYEMVCNTCKLSLNKKSMPLLAKVNGFSYPDQPSGLPPLDPISERLISPRLPFMQVRRLRHDLSYGIIGQVINVPVGVQEIVKCLPRQLNEDDVINVNFKRNLAHKSVYISEYMSESTISAWLNVLEKSALYRLYEINVDLSRLHPTVPLLDNIHDDPSNRIENISADNTPESEVLASRQHTMMWNEEDCLNIAAGHQATPPNIIYDCHAEELSFPSIYFGEPRQFNKRVPVTPHMIVTSEIRRRDRRGATPQKILYVAMKILRLRIYSTFRNVSVTENVTRRMLEDTEFLKEYFIENLAFMKTVPNSVQYWASRKRDLFAMIRQLGKPTVFLTISANEIRWMHLLTILLKLSNKYPGKTAKELNTSERCTLVSDDPVTCCIYFYKLVGSLMKMLKSKQSHNPFGKYFVKDYFLSIEFQHRGSPQAHILLWLNDDPRETVSEYMPRTIDLVEKLSSVARDDVPNNSTYANQIHKHNFTCTKPGETTCRFEIPYWPIPTTRVLVPIPQSDKRRQTLQQKANELRTSLGEHRYACMDEFLNAHGLTYVSYLDIVRSTLRRPTLMFKRNFDELMTNTFNPYLAGEINSYIDIQFILDEYSCAEYVVEYVNKSSSGMSNLRRELTTLMLEHPDQDYTGKLEALSIKLLNAVEMSTQEAAWYLLRQPMSETSRQVVYIPTVWPAERQRCRKRRQQMDREGIDGNSTDVWIKNIIQRYEERPASLEQVYLAEFTSWYAHANDIVDEEDDGDDDEDSGARASRASKEYRRRPFGRVIRCRRYDIDDTINYKREMVLLYVQFRNEMSEIVDQNKFLQLFDDNKDAIMERRSLFETNLDVENFMKELEEQLDQSTSDNIID